jgi:CheY-like chemotaxis protein/HPt (histidine-containing phosphotransfer) domain-containing protein
MGQQPLQPSAGGNFEPGLFTQDELLRDIPRTILVAEDNAVNQRIISLLLEKLGLQAYVVHNGLEAVKAVSEKDYPVVLMDCHMPEMDGFEATRAIRRMEAATGKHTPIIAVTALAMAGDRERCIEAGMDDYIPKPIDKERLKNKLNQWMNKEFAFHNQKLAEKFFEASARVPTFHAEPIDLAELEVFYGSQEEMEEVLRLFVSTTERQLPDLEMAVTEKRGTLAARMAHELKGASASVGAKEMSLICLQLEQQSGQQDWQSAKETCARLTQCFDSVSAFILRSFTKSAQRTAQS